MRTEEVLEALGDLYGLCRDPIVLDAMSEIERQRECIAKLAAAMLANVIFFERLFKEGQLSEAEFKAIHKNAHAYLSDCGVIVRDHRDGRTGMN